MSKVKIQSAGFVKRALDKFERDMPKRIDQALRDALKSQSPARTRKRKAERPEHPMIKLSSGREIYPNMNVLGVLMSDGTSRFDEDVLIYGGYDELLHPHGYGPPLTPDEVCELAELAIARWQQVKAMARPEHP